MSAAAPRVRGWCPGALRPMLSGDGMLLRVRPMLGEVSAEAMRGLCDLAGRHGNGLIDLTSRANLQLRGASRVLVRLGAFYAAHLAQLDKRARQLPWSAFLAPNTPIRVEATCRKSRIYHSGAAAERIAAAAVHEAGAR